MRGTEEANSKLRYFTIVRTSGKEGWDSEITTKTIIRVPLNECLLCSRHCVQSFYAQQHIILASVGPHEVTTFHHIGRPTKWQLHAVEPHISTCILQKRPQQLLGMGVHGLLVHAASSPLPWTVAMQMLEWAPLCKAKGDITYVWGFALHCKCLTH